jgi:hypothetical protein
MCLEFEHEGMDEVIKRLAFCIWQDRKRNSEPDADNARQNYLRAKHALYPMCMTAEEWKEVG